MDWIDWRLFVWAGAVIVGIVALVLVPPIRTAWLSYGARSVALSPVENATHKSYYWALAGLGTALTAEAMRRLEAASTPLGGRWFGPVLLGASTIFLALGLVPALGNLLLRRKAMRGFVLGSLRFDVALRGLGQHFRCCQSDEKSLKEFLLNNGLGKWAVAPIIDHFVGMPDVHG